MKVVGIVAEYNPFHNGHAYQIAQLREKTKADYIIVAMSGNFQQRGVPALCDKFSRAHMALLNGADMVLEIPTIWATASAEYFACGGVSTLAATGVVTHLGFGAEANSLAPLKEITAVLKNEPEVYRKVLSNSIRSGNPFPVARKNALFTTLPHIPRAELENILNSPNNILALEYLKALPEHIQPVLIPRKGAGYHDTEINTEFPSASAIREALLGENPEESIDLVKKAMPATAFDILKELFDTGALLEPNDISDVLGYCLLCLTRKGYDSFADCNMDLSNKIRKHLNEYVTFNDFVMTLKSKDLTHTRISRCLLHILLGIKQTDYSIGKAIGFAPYLRVLGFKKDATDLLSEISEKATSPIITKVVEAERMLDYETYKSFERDILASNLFYQRTANKSNTKPVNEYTHQMVIL
jgi:predicted nucleotidyltransferase